MLPITQDSVEYVRGAMTSSMPHIASILERAATALLTRTWPPYFFVHVNETNEPYTVNLSSTLVDDVGDARRIVDTLGYRKWDVKTEIKFDGGKRKRTTKFKTTMYFPREVSIRVEITATHTEEDELDKKFETEQFFGKQDGTSVMSLPGEIMEPESAGAAVESDSEEVSS